VLLHLLRCVRRVWALAVHDQDLQAAALQALSDAGLDAPSASGDPTPAGPLVPLAASLGRSLLQVLQGTKKRPLVLCGTLINTLMLPELMLFDPQQYPTFVSLHDGHEAPLRRFVAGLLQQGPRASKGSPTLHVIVALRLGACVPSAPQLLEWYADELRHLLLFGGTMEAGLEIKVSLVAYCHPQPWVVRLSSRPAEQTTACSCVMSVGLCCTCAEGVVSNHTLAHCSDCASS
jgi:hypothetical protein